jgi:2-oxoglutarate dehydrogenase E1 component
MAESLAFASLLQEGYGVRISGQDSGRGTFFHRHAVLHDQNRKDPFDGTHIPLQHVAEGQPRFTVIDSTLSEEAVLGFEYGFTTAEPTSLTIWEGQFGDFANGAQVVIDQFISAGETKWGRLCHLTMMLPHGYEGQGPEHSSARLERYLQLSAEYNMQVVVPSTPAQVFHMLRRQMVRPIRKPLVVMWPKSLLRLDASASSLDELSNGSFQTIIDDKDANVADIKRVVVCSGKVYYELLAERNKRGLKDVALVRLEQIYPFPHEEYAELVAKYSNATEIVWTQEEPRNQGAWHRIRHYLERPLNGQKLDSAGRDSSASPAVGYPAKHKAQQEGLVNQALTR